VIVELSTRKREIRGDGGNHHEKLGLKRISCASEFTIPDKAGTSPDPAGNYTDTRSSQPIQAGRTPDFLYPLVSSTLFSTSSTYLSFSSTTLPSSQNTNLSHPSLSVHAMIMSWHQVQHTPSTAYTEYCIHRVLHHPNIDCLPLPASLSSLGRPCCTQFSTFPQLRVNQWIESQLPSCLPPALQPPDWPPPSTAPNSLDHGLKVHLHTRSITASQYISEFTQYRSPIASPTSLDHGLKVNLQLRSITAS